MWLCAVCCVLTARQVGIHEVEIPCFEACSLTVFVFQWAGNIAQRFFTRYGQPHYADEGMTEFAEAFSKQLAPKLLEQVRNLSLRLCFS